MSLTRAGKPLVLWIVSPKLRKKLKFGATFIISFAKNLFLIKVWRNIYVIFRQNDLLCARFNLTKVSIESSSGKIFRK